MSIRRFLSGIFGRKTLSLEEIRKSRIKLIVENKIEELRRKGESGPITHLRYLALNDFYKDRWAMKKFIFANGLYFVNLKDVENIGKVKEEERPLVHNRIDSWERSIDNTMEVFFKLIEQRVSELRARGSTEEGVVCGLEFLALEELFEENELIRKKIKKRYWKKARYANCMIACIEDLESRVQVDKILRKKLGQRTGSYVYKTLPNLDLFVDVLNRVYEQKRKSLLAKGQEKQLREFRTQKAYKVNIERLIYNYKKAENFMIIYKPNNQIIYHALKVLEIENDMIIAQDLYTGIDKSDIRKHRVADLIAKGEEIFVVMDSDELTKEELSTITLSTDEISGVEKIVTLNDFLEEWVYFKIKIEKLKEHCQFFLSESESLNVVMVFYDFKNGTYQYIVPFNELIHEYIYKKAQRSVVLSKFIEGSQMKLLLGAPREIKGKYFKEEKELSEEERKSIKVVISI